MRGLRVLGAGVISLGLLTIAVPAQASTPPSRTVSSSATRPLTGMSSADPDDRIFGRDLRGDQVLPQGDARAMRVRTWPGTKIRYYETIPAKWDWSLNQAIKQWNSAGGKIKFVKVKSPGRAQLKISYGFTGGADGMATLGYTPRAWVHLGTGYKRVSATDPLMRGWVVRLFAHELGHVLGFGHTTGTCSLMVAVFNLSTCPVLGSMPGYYFCRIIDKPLLRRFIARYGGTAARPPAEGLFDPLPPQLSGVTFGGGQTAGGPVEVTWTKPTGVPPGSTVTVTVGKTADCNAMPPSVDTYRVPPAAGTWTDPGHGQGSHCYALQITNRYGATQPPISGLVARWAPVPAAPAIGTPTWSSTDQAFRLTWTPPDSGTHLEVLHGQSGNPTVCRSTYNQNDTSWPWEQAGFWLVYPWAPVDCLAVFAVTDWGTVSPATNVTVTVPLPGVSPTVGTVRADPDVDGAFLVSASLPDQSYRLGIEVVAGSCPAAVPAGATFWDGWDIGAGNWQLYPEQTGTNCAIVAALDNWDRHGPVVMKPFTWAG